MLSLVTRHLKETGSTNDDALAWAQNGAPHGAVVRADVQTQGRGRAGRNWESPEGLGLYFSLVLRPQIEISQVPQLTMLAALAAALATESVTQIPCNVKWPNDIILRGGKIGGVLSEARSDGEARSDNTNLVAFAIIGIGINVNFSRADLPPRPILPATSLYIETGRVHSTDEVFNEYGKQFAALYDAWENAGWPQLRDEWLQRDVLQHRRVKAQGVEGVACGVDESGALLLQTSRGAQRIVAGDVETDEEYFA
jgi:BirA family transcriptional regulator, biotin operon repressor / biotin---[acetyl-CoA-carboxylase] ligase